MSENQTSQDPVTADLCIQGGTVITMDPDRRILEDGLIYLHKDRILSIGSRDGQGEEKPAKKTLSAEGKLVLPGLINAHSHLAMTLFRGYAEDLALQQWLEKVWAIELTVLDEQAVRAGSSLAFAEMIKGGITCAHDMYWHYQQTMTLAEEIGFRLISGPPITSLGDQDVEEMFQAVRDNFAWQKELDFVYPILQTHSAYTTTSEMMARVQSLKEDYGLCFTTHASENQAEVDSVQAKHHRSPIQVLHHHHLLDESTILVHCVQVDEGELELLSETGSSVAHCPESNLKLGSGIAPIAAMLEKNINLCVGTDGAASNNDLNILGEIRTAAMLQKGVTRHPEMFTTAQALEMITLNSAQAYHLDELIGSLEPGKKADLVLINLEKAHLMPVHDPIANLIYAADRSDVDTVIIDGKIQLQDGRLTRLDEEKIKADVRSTQTLFQP